MHDRHVPLQPVGLRSLSLALALALSLSREGRAQRSQQLPRPGHGPDSALGNNFDVTRDPAADLKLI